MFGIKSDEVNERFKEFRHEKSNLCCRDHLLFYVTEIREITIEGSHEKNKRDEECIQNFVLEPPENPRILWITLRWVFGRQVMESDFDKHCQMFEICYYSLVSESKKTKLNEQLTNKPDN